MDEAFAAYEGVRHRLPSTQGNGACQRLTDLSALAPDIEVFFLDAFGVLNIGETAIPGAPERVAALQGQGKRVLVVSNAASHPHASLVSKYKRMGFDFAPRDVVTSRLTALHALRKEPDCHWGLMASEDLGREDFEHLNATYLAEERSAYDSVDAFLLMGSAGWTEDRQARLENSLNHRPRPVVVANPDIVAPREYGFSTEPGHFAHRLADRTGIQPRFFGKPFQSIYDFAFARLDNVDPARVVMVGDSLHTDILGAQTAGVRSALIARFGFFADGDAEKAIEISGIRPDYILDRP
ncbi:MAG: HAD-IIA family hydrolase [Silicimonas sp.]|nr:HAD-IIA family hydrolase [Silicimonas sp.]